MKNLIISCSVLFMLTSCSSQFAREEEKQAEQAMAQEPADTPEDIAMRAASIFENAPNLSLEQKSEISKIYNKVYDDSMGIRRDIGQYKSLLYMTLVKENYKSTEVDRITKKIVALDKQRLDIMFKALKDVQKIIGHGADKEKIYKQLGKNIN